VKANILRIRLENGGEMMVKKRTKALSAVFAALAVALLFSMAMSVAYATKPIPVSGQIIILGATNVVTEPAGGSDNSITTLNLYGVFVGSISGSYTSESRWITHNFGMPDSWTHALGVDTISPAAVMGKTGTITFLLDGKTGEGGTWVIIGGTGDLANLRGQGKYTPSATSTYINIYEGQIHFDP
jgi:hypothetical protein